MQMKILPPSNSHFKECAYCGSTEGLSDDHIPPECMFIKEKRPDPMITVKACIKCNGEKSRYDSVLRDMIYFDVYGSKAADARLHQEKALRAAKRNRSEVARRMLEQAKPTPIQTKDGIYLGNLPTAPAADLISPAMTWLSRGFYYFAFEERLASNLNYEFNRYHPHEYNDVINLFANFASISVMAGEVCHVLIGRQEEPDFMTFSLFLFNNTMLVLVSAMDKNAKERCDAL